MNPSIATIVYSLGILVLFYLSRDSHSRTSKTLWIPIVWIFIVGSRLPSQWIEGGDIQQLASAMQEGSPLDRTVYLVLMVLAMAVLLSRAFNWGSFVKNNGILMAYIGFGLVSMCWSDFPFIAVKRWFRDLGNYLVILVVMSDVHPLNAFRTVVRQVCLLLIPLSLLFIKYYPEIGRQYTEWEGITMYVGATTSKNMLGVLCLVSGLFFFWDIVAQWQDRQDRQTRRILWADALMLGLTLWLLALSDSATSRICLTLGFVVIVVQQTRWFHSRPAILKSLIPIGVVAYLTMTFGLGFDLNAVVAEAVGRNPTLTGRTEIWRALLSMHTNPLLGTGYQTFWLGDRLDWIWNNPACGKINETHNGYLDIYLNLGIVGLLLLTAFLASSYRRICRNLPSLENIASLTLAVWTILLFYNVTEAAFAGGLLWLMLLPGVLVVSGLADDLPVQHNFNQVMNDNSFPDFAEAIAERR